MARLTTTTTRRRSSRSGGLSKPRKPDYAVPSMEDVGSVEPNGFNLISTFSGCGGSCLGFRMAGFRTLFASEFIPAAADVYEANHPGVFVDRRDIREVSVENILARTGLSIGEVDVLEGSPPCSSFSTAGKRSKKWGETNKYSDKAQRTDDLFFEFARILEGLKPKVFVAENVSGLVKGVAKGYFIQILARLRSAGYNVAAKVLDARWLGVPQMRQRLIFIGVRSDFGVNPIFPKPLQYCYSIRDACPWIAGGPEANPFLIEKESWLKATNVIGKGWDKLRPGQSSDKYFNLVKIDPLRPCNTICQTHGSSGTASTVHPYEKRKLSIAELKRICAFPDDFKLSGKYKKDYERLGRAVPPVMMRAVAAEVASVLRSISNG